MFKSSDLGVPRQLIKNCVSNSVVAVLIELRDCWGYFNITDDLIRKYRRLLSMQRMSTSFINTAMMEVGCNFEFVQTVGSLMSSLRSKQASLAIATQFQSRGAGLFSVGAFRHAYPIKINQVGQYVTINQFAKQFKRPCYEPLFDVDDIAYFLLRPIFRTYTPKDDGCTQRELEKLGVEEPYDII